MITTLLQLVSSGKDSTIRTWRPDLKASMSTAPEDQLPPPVEYFSNQTVHVTNGNVTALAFSRKGMLATGSDDHVVSLWNVDSVSATISVFWTSRGKIDVHDGMFPRRIFEMVTFIQQGWCHVWYGVVLPVQTFYFLGVRTAQLRLTFISAISDATYSN
jgi:WD40 repeat protein